MGAVCLAEGFPCEGSLPLHSQQYQGLPCLSPCALSFPSARPLLSHVQGILAAGILQTLISLPGVSPRHAPCCREVMELLSLSPQCSGGLEGPCG